MEPRTEDKEKPSIKHWSKYLNFDREIAKTAWEDKIQTAKGNRANNSVWNEDVGDTEE